MLKKVVIVKAEDALFRFNDAIEAVGQIPVREFCPPILFICGAPRSGTTLVYQCLVHGGQLGYISNLIARFVGNPELGIRLAQALELSSKFDAMSTFGQTSTLSGPHEFGRGWNKILNIKSLVQPEGSVELDQWAAEKIRRISAAWERPVVFKSFGYLWFIEEIAKQLPSSLWLHISRSPVDNARSLKSLYDNRIESGIECVWHSAVCRRTVENGASLDLEARCLKQVEDLNGYITQQFSGIPSERKYSIKMEDFVANPSRITGDILRYFSLPVDESCLKEIVL